MHVINFLHALLNACCICLFVCYLYAANMCIDMLLQHLCCCCCPAGCPCAGSSHHQPPPPPPPRRVCAHPSREEGVVQQAEAAEEQACSQSSSSSSISKAGRQGLAGWQQVASAAASCRHVKGRWVLSSTHVCTAGLHADACSTM